jgi:hypothetical protein
MSRVSIGAIVVFAVGAVVGIILAVTDASDNAAGVLLAASGVYAVSALVFSTGPIRRMAQREIKYDREDGDNGNGDVTVEPLTELPRTGWEKDRTGKTLERNTDYKEQRGLYFQALLLGKDGRWSTSKVQLLAWTYAVVFGLAALIIAMWLGDDAGWKAQIDHGLQEEYLVLLGGPFAAAVLAKTITTQKVENGTIQKTASEPTSDPVQGIGEVVSDDKGSVDLGDLQYFLFNLLALVYFLGTFLSHFDQGFPDLPGLLVGLTSVSAAAYVSKKAADREVPSVTSVFPPKAEPGQRIDLWGKYLIVRLASTKEDRLPQILINDKSAPPEVVNDGLTISDHLQLTVPEDADPGDTSVLLITAAGVAPEKPFPFQVLPKNRQPTKPGVP